MATGLPPDVRSCAIRSRFQLRSARAVWVLLVAVKPAMAEAGPPPDPPRYSGVRRNDEPTSWAPRAASLLHLADEALAGVHLDATCRVRGITRLVVTGQHTDCCCRHTSYDAFARGITVTAVSDATAVNEPFAAGRCQQDQDDALSYLRTYYGAEITSTAALV